MTIWTYRWQGRISIAPRDAEVADGVEGGFYAARPDSTIRLRRTFAMAGFISRRRESCSVTPIR